MIPPEYIQRRAARVWRCFLGDPFFQMEAPGQETFTGAMSSALADMAASKSAPADSAYQIFEDKLTEILMEPWVLDHDRGRPWVRAITDMEVDYHPDQVLATAANYANISSIRFPCKTRIWTHNTYTKRGVTSRPYVSVAAGYGSDAVHHYPVFMKDDHPQGWFLTKMQGADIDGLLRHIESVYSLGHEGRILGIGEIEWV